MNKMNENVYNTDNIYDWKYNASTCKVLFLVTNDCHLISLLINLTSSHARWYTDKECWTMILCYHIPKLTKIIMSKSVPARFSPAVQWEYGTRIP